MRRKLNCESLETRRLLSSSGIYGTNAPIGPQTGVVAPAGAIVFNPGQTATTIEATVSEAPADSKFFFLPGTYHDVSITVKPGDQFIGAQGAILTSAVDPFAFRGGGAAGQAVRISNLTINGYSPPYQYSAVQGGDYWNIDHVEVLNSATGGVLVGSFSTVSDSYVHDNGQLGIKAFSTDDACTSVLVTNTRVSHNNPSGAYDFQVEAGGSKFWNVNGLTIANCEFDGNVGDGIWLDGNLAGGGNSNVTVAFNWTHNNGRYGIFQEIGGSATINNNLSETNGMSGLANADGAGIQLDNSESVAITNNIVRNNYNGIVLQSYPRGDTNHTIRSDTVTFNSVTMTRGITGVIYSGGANNVTSVTFDYNTYSLSGSASFAWNGSWSYTLAQWRAAGNDTHAAPPPATVVSRLLFYNQSGTASPSRYDGNNVAISAADDNAIASDKVAYRGGNGPATFANVSSYSKGINGIMIDIAGQHGTITTADFTFRMGNNNLPTLWGTAPTPVSISVRVGAGMGGSDRVELIWDNTGTGGLHDAVSKKWLEVIIKANGNTGLAQLAGAAANIGDVFFWGSAVGDSGQGDSSTNATVDSNDELEARNHAASALTNVPITNTRDYNRDAAVDSRDALVSRNSPTTLGTVTKFLNLTLANAAPDSKDNGSMASALSSSALLQASFEARPAAHSADQHIPSDAIAADAPLPPPRMLKDAPRLRALLKIHARGATEPLTIESSLDDGP